MKNNRHNLAARDLKLEAEYRIELGAFLKARRTMRAVSQREVADHLGYSSPQFVSNWERGVTLPPLETLAKLSRFLAIPAKEVTRIILRFQARAKTLQRQQVMRLFKPEGGSRSFE